MLVRCGELAITGHHGSRNSSCLTSILSHGKGDSAPQKSRARQSHRPVSFQVLYSLLNQNENMDGWPRVVSEDIVKQVHRLKNEMFVMGGKIKGKTLLPIPEHLGSLDGTLESMERWVADGGGREPS